MHIPVQKYPVIMRWIHWLTAVMILIAIAIGLYVNMLPKEYRGAAFGLHKSLGITVLALLMIRIAVRMKYTVPKLRETMPRYEHFLARAGHVSLYVLMGVMPLSGLVMNQAGGRVVYWFGVELPMLVDKNPALRNAAQDIHDMAANFLIAIICLHVLAVVKHWVVDKENLLRKMI